MWHKGAAGVNKLQWIFSRSYSPLYVPSNSRRKIDGSIWYNLKTFRPLLMLAPDSLAVCS